MRLGTVIETDALLQLLWAAPAAGLVVTIAFSLTIRGATRTADMRSAGHRVSAAAYGALAVIGAVVVVAALVFGVVVMTTK